ncbi:MAG: hypothetical protein IJE46_06360 [Clostridia bacterium]|nr:hypothetical protein [Clostridia bacterium]
MYSKEIYNYALMSVEKMGYKFETIEKKGIIMVPNVKISENTDETMRVGIQVGKSDFTLFVPIFSLQKRSEIKVSEIIMMINNRLASPEFLLFYEQKLVCCRMVGDVRQKMLLSDTSWSVLGMMFRTLGENIKKYKSVIRAVDEGTLSPKEALASIE